MPSTSHLDNAETAVVQAQAALADCTRNTMVTPSLQQGIDQAKAALERAIRAIQAEEYALNLRNR